MGRSTSAALVAVLACTLANAAVLRNGIAPTAKSLNTTTLRINHALVGSTQNASQNASAKASLNASKFNPVVTAAVGEVTTLYYAVSTDQYAQTISAAKDPYPAAREKAVWFGGGFLPEPSCKLQINTRLGWTENRKANERLASIAVCDYLQHSTMDNLPSCGAGEGQVCELMVDLPMPNSDEFQEPHIGAAMALAAYSKICSLIHEDYRCQVHRSGKAILAGLQRTTSGVALSGFKLSGILNMRLTDAERLYFDEVYLGKSGESVYEQTNFFEHKDDVLHHSTKPPTVWFCNDLDCLIRYFINPNR